MTSWARVGVLVLGGGLLCSSGAVGCAKGGGSDTGDEPKGGSGGVGGVGGTGGTGGEGGLGGMGGQGGEPPACSEEPCKLVLPQCGCDEGTTQCQIDQAGVRSCVPEGTSEPGTFCTQDCTPGYTCLNNGGTGLASVCHKFCATDVDCPAPGGLCINPVAGGAAKACSQNCDPVTDTGCKENEPSLKCDIAQELAPPNRWLTRCVNAGAGVQDSVCTSINQCAPGHGCIGVDMEPENHCLRWCNLGAPNCPGGTHMCVGFTTPIIIGSITYGACVPF
jgi:hypothetical protein